jgi:hypothetical protein
MNLPPKPAHLRQLTRQDIIGFIAAGENLPPMLKALAFTQINKLTDADAAQAGTLAAELIDAIYYGETEKFTQILRAAKVPFSIILMFEKYLNDINSLQ